MKEMAERRDFSELNKFKFFDEGIETITSLEQIKVEQTIDVLFGRHKQIADIDPESPTFFKNRHISFLRNSLSHLTSGYECLDASRPWLCYWIIHSLDLLDQSIEVDDAIKVANFIKNCQCPKGGFGGGPGQYAHLATTYAAVNVLCILGIPEAFDVINRKTLYEFLTRVRTSSGAFQMHEEGEVDIRGVYCALSIAKLTNIHTEDLFRGSPEWIISCQTYEGGFSGFPGLEAHGGYAFCGFAALTLLGKTHLCDSKALLRWLVNRQMRFEGGFQGRTNKLVDGCYSFWQGGALALIHMLLNYSTKSESRWIFHQEALQEYILICCQNSSGGLIDKPEKPRDIYHTCYTLSGLSVAQHSPSSNHDPIIVGTEDSELTPIHPVYNICIGSVRKAIFYFEDLPFPT